MAKQLSLASGGGDDGGGGYPPKRYKSPAQLKRDRSRNQNIQAKDPPPKLARHWAGDLGASGSGAPPPEQQLNNTRGSGGGVGEKGRSNPES